jgi:hypothetical protein
MACQCTLVRTAIESRAHEAPKDTHTANEDPLARRRPMARKMLTMKLIADGSAASFNVVRQLVLFGKICS